MCYWFLVEIEQLTVGCQVSMQLELPIICFVRPLVTVTREKVVHLGSGIGRTRQHRQAAQQVAQTSVSSTVLELMPHPQLTLRCTWAEGNHWVWCPGWVCRVYDCKAKIGYCCTSQVQPHSGVSLNARDEGNSLWPKSQAVCLPQEILWGTNAWFMGSSEWLGQ